MNEFDQFVKHMLKVRYYARYTDDFVIVSDDREYLTQMLPPIRDFLDERLKLSLHADKVAILPCHGGVDFLGQVIFPHYRLLRARTRRRIFRKVREKVQQFKSGVITEKALQQSLRSFLGVFSHSNGYEVSEKLKNQCWFWMTE